MSTWSEILSKFRWLMAAIAVVVAIGVGFSVFLYLASEETAEAHGRSLADVRQARQKAREASENQYKKLMEDRNRRELEREEEWKRFGEGSTDRVEMEAESKSRPKNRRVRRVRRWAWMSPAEKIAKFWNVPHEETSEATVTGLLRICTSEQEGSEEDCIGIYQVLSNIRSRRCNRQYFNLITECDDDGETLISVMRRASRYVVGAVPARYARQRWISEMTTECDMPQSYPPTVKRHCQRNLKQCAQGFWEKRHRHHCEETTELARGLVSGKNTERITGARIIAWGGRCESPRGACDDPIACSRGLVRDLTIERMDEPGRPANAFWRRPFEPTIDPLCKQMGFGEQEVASSGDNGINPQGG